MSAIPPAGSHPYSDAELQEMVARLSALTSEPASESIAIELEGIRAHLRRLAADNAEIRKMLGRLDGAQQ